MEGDPTVDTYCEARPPTLLLKALDTITISPPTVHSAPTFDDRLVTSSTGTANSLALFHLLQSIPRLCYAIYGHASLVSVNPTDFTWLIQTHVDTCPWVYMCFNRSHAHSGIFALCICQWSAGWCFLFGSHTWTSSDPNHTITSVTTKLAIPSLSFSAVHRHRVGCLPR